jgi:hypothetical protein
MIVECHTVHFAKKEINPNTIRENMYQVYFHRLFGTKNNFFVLHRN